MFNLRFYRVPLINHHKYNEINIKEGADTKSFVLLLIIQISFLRYPKKSSLYPHCLEVVFR